MANRGVYVYDIEAMLNQGGFLKHEREGPWLGFRISTFYFSTTSSVYIYFEWLLDFLLYEQ